ncbi:MAG: hypothetical protein A2855_00855 [Candidatus Liptonbacteria bacterium RIFCSPHIGHO2_01_FULL_57_28]|uniref:Xylose isomerase-like TIM barrel domain-containing protein n=1 Tax=Candidatus Liptonbacteria bacterium RIFCSPHIGHO2_01_FULL_57_28 TaxID=1798647 RepID=A0A1G2CCY9_9BACT|nr:MAG: hypothetical protein A2855_00855 [Candidatus Liptonbacteria bacterium RIFCSPHIGHO2_01_FULL_57_28]
MILGFNVGRLGELSLKETIDLHRELGCNAIEINLGEADDQERMTRVKELTAEDLAFFEYVSVHAPARDMVYGEDDLTKRVLGDIQELYERFHFKYAVMHPDRIKDWSIFKDYSFPVATENMDNKKEIARTVDSLKTLFQKVDIPMVLDMNHCYVNDNTLQLAADMYSAFKDRIVQIHLSGFKTFHEPLYETKQAQIIRAVPDKNLPIILESTVTSEEGIRAEYEYVKNNL